MIKRLSRTICISLCSLLFAINLSAQSSDSKFSLGGDFGLQFGTITLINISPKLGYRATEKFTFGPGLVYQYFRDNRYGISTSVYGASAFGRYTIFENVAAYSEFQQLYYSITAEGQSLSREVPILFVGGQYFSNLGGNFNLSISILFDILENENSPYQNPYIGLGGAYLF